VAGSLRWSAASKVHLSAGRSLKTAHFEEGNLGRAITFSSMASDPAKAGVLRTPVTTDDLKTMSMEFLRLDPGAMYSFKIPAGSDGYLFILSGSATITVDEVSKLMTLESFAAIKEGSVFKLENTAKETIEAVFVLAPPAGADAKLDGLAENLTVTARDGAPIAHIADQKKKRIYFVAKEAARSQRAHAMIVEYEKDTYTQLHHHPNAESLFVLLSGRIKFTFNGKDEVLERGQAVYFPMNDRHALRCADDSASASFLEFHIPASYTTVKEQP
jgi:mannose-6-phosphate isomerase-like protein (cupin superfamily)